MNMHRLYATQPVNPTQQQRLYPERNRRYTPCPYPLIRPYTQQFLGGSFSLSQYGQPSQAYTNTSEKLPEALNCIKQPQNNGPIGSLIYQGKLKNNPVYF